MLSALFDFLKDETILTEEEFTQFYGKADELSRITPVGVTRVVSDDWEFDGELSGSNPK